MTAASGGPAEKPEYPGDASGSSGSAIPPPDPAYAEWPMPDPAPPAYPPPPPPPPVGYYPPPMPPPMPPPYPWGYPYPGVPRPGTNALAIVSIVASLAGVLCCPGAAVGVIAGAVALTQIRRTGESGTALALAGIVIGALVLVGSLAFLAVLPTTAGV